MLPGHLYFTMEEKLASATKPFCPGSVYAFILRWVIRFFSISLSYLQSKINFFGCSKNWIEDDLDFELPIGKFYLHQKGEDDNMCREDVEMVMGKLGIFCNPESEKLQERLGFNELSGLFEEKEPSLEEVKEAFYVFDENRDGFIDARELQRVLCVLGLSEGSRLEDCKRMIRDFDENGDGRIDFNEFVKFMENSFC